MNPNGGPLNAVSEAALEFRKKCYPIGLKIKSKRVGKVEPFIGDVVGYTRDEFLVRDYKTGRKWIRSQGELEILENQD